MLSLFSTDIFTVTHAIVEYFAIDFAPISAPNSVYICTSANPRGLTKAGPTSTTSSSKASSLPKAPPENHLLPRRPPPSSPCRVARLGSQTLLRFVRPSRPPRHSRARQRVAGSPRQSAVRCSTFVGDRRDSPGCRQLRPAGRSCRSSAHRRIARGRARPRRLSVLDCKQVLIGLAVNRDGFPLAHEVLAGNRHDSSTLKQMLE